MRSRSKKNLNSAKQWDKSAWLAKSQHRSTNSAIFVSPICDIKITACGAGLHSIVWQNEEGSNGDLKSSALLLRDEWGDLTYQDGSTSKHIEEAAEWLRHFFNDPHQPWLEPSLCYDQVKATSCIPIWHKLKDNVGPGKTISYGELAILCGNPKASRHMGYAMGHNHFSLVVPCHRVVTASGALGNYCRGRKNQLKAWLYEHERTPPAAKVC